MAKGEVGLDSFFLGVEAKLLEAGDLGLGERLVGEVARARGRARARARSEPSPPPFPAVPRPARGGALDASRRKLSASSSPGSTLEEVTGPRVWSGPRMCAAGSSSPLSDLRRRET